MLLGADIPAAPAQEGPESPIDVKGLVTEVLPTAYPRLIACLRQRGPLRAVDGAGAGYRLSMGADGLTVEGSRPPDPPGNPAGDPAGDPGGGSAEFLLLDADLDARLDRVTWRGAGIPGGRFVIDDPQDDAALGLWYLALHAAIGPAPSARCPAGRIGRPEMAPARHGLSPGAGLR